MMNLRNDEQVLEESKSKAFRILPVTIDFVRAIESKDPSSKAMAIAIRLKYFTPTGKEKTYDLFGDTGGNIYITNRNGDIVENNAKRIRGLWTILDIEDEKTKKMTVKMYGKDAQISVFPSFTGKKILVGLLTKRFFKTKRINGITLDMVNWNNIERGSNEAKEVYSNPEYIDIPDYSNDAKFAFLPVGWFDIKTKLSASETVLSRKGEDVSPEKIKQLEERYATYEAKIKTMSPKELDEYIEKQVFKNIAKANSCKVDEVELTPQQKAKRRFFAQENQFKDDGDAPEDFGAEQDEDFEF